MLAGPEAAHCAVAQPDLHLAAQDEHPLRLRRAVPLAAKADWAVAQLITRGRKDRRKKRLRIAFGEFDRFLSESRSPIAIGEQHHLRETTHRVRYFSIALGCSAMPCPGLFGMRMKPSLHSGSSAKRSGGAQSMNSTRKPFAAAPTTWMAISWMRCGVSGGESSDAQGLGKTIGAAHVGHRVLHCPAIEKLLEFPAGVVVLAARDRNADRARHFGVAVVVIGE